MEGYKEEPYSVVELERSWVSYCNRNRLFVLSYTYIRMFHGVQIAFFQDIPSMLVYVRWLILINREISRRRDRPLTSSAIHNIKECTERIISIPATINSKDLTYFAGIKKSISYPISHFFSLSPFHIVPPAQTT